MTREEALSIIEERVHVTEYVKSSYVDCVDIDALKMAIEALRQPEIIRCKDCKHHKDEEPGMVYCPIIVGGWVREDCSCWNAKRREE